MKYFTPEICDELPEVVFPQGMVEGSRCDGCVYLHKCFVTVRANDGDNLLVVRKNRKPH